METKKTELIFNETRYYPHTSADAVWLNSGKNVEDEVKQIKEDAYVHPDTPGNKHIPLGGAVGNYLSYNADGEAKWSKLSEQFPVTFIVAKWLNSTYTITSSDISVMVENYFSSMNIIEVIAGDAMTKDQLDAWRAANILKAEWNDTCTAITFTAVGDTPTTNIPVILIIRRD